MVNQGNSGGSNTGGPHEANGGENMGGRGRIVQRLKQNPKIVGALIVIAIIVLVGGIAYWQILETRLYIENSQIKAPIITLAPQSSGVIDKFYVSEGDHVRRNQVLAKVGDELIRAKKEGRVISLMNTPGQLAGPQSAVVQMIEPKQLRVVGRLEEDKGLSDVHVGQRVIFTADAFGSKEYEGVVDSIASTARQADIVFSISDKREEKEFEVKATFDVDAYPELKNGMSAKMWVYK